MKWTTCTCKTTVPKICRKNPSKNKYEIMINDNFGGGGEFNKKAFNRQDISKTCHFTVKNF